MLNTTDKSWGKVAERVILYTESYLDFEGEYWPSGRQRHICDLASIVRDDWGRSFLIIQKGSHDFSTTCDSGFKAMDIKSDCSARGDPA